MKTVGEFIQRVQVDPAFEKQAQAFDNGDEFIAFVKSEGYDFTLEQLVDEFKQGAELSAQAGGMAPASTEAGAVTPWPPDDREFSPQPEAFPKDEESAATGKPGSNDSTWEPLGQKLQKPQEAAPPTGPAEESPAGLFGSGGGRHRGFSPQRLKSSGEEDS